MALKDNNKNDNNNNNNSKIFMSAFRSLKALTCHL